MARAPHVTAIVDIDDKLTPGLSKIIQELEKLSTGAATALDGKLGKSLLKLDEQFLKLGLTAKEALSPAMMKELALETAGVTRQIKALDQTANNVGTSMRNAVTHAGHFREMMRGASESLKLIAAFELPHALRELILAGGKLNATIEGDLPAVGVPEGERQTMINRSREIAAEVRMTTPSEVLETALEIRGELIPHGTFKNKEEESKAVTEESLKLAELAAQANHALKSSGDDKGFSSTDLRNLMKFTEKVGKADDPKFIHDLIEQYVKVKQVDRSFIESGKFFDYIVNAKAAGLPLSNDFLIKTLPVWLAGGQAPRLGNETAQLMKTLAGGNVLKGTAHWLEDMGLITPDQLVKTGPGSFQIKGGVKGSELLMVDPQRWAQEIMAPALAEHGFKPEDIKAKLSQYLSEDELASKGNKIADAKSLLSSGMRGTVVDLLTEMIANSVNVEKNKEKVEHAAGLDAQGFVTSNATAALMELQSSIESFAGALTNPIMKDAAGVMADWSKKVANAAKDYAEWTDENPTAAKAVTAGTLVTGGALTAYMFSSIGRLATAGPKLDSAGDKLSLAASQLSNAALKSGTAGNATETAAATAAATTTGVGFWTAAGIAVRMGAVMTMLEGLANYTTPQEDQVLADADAKEADLRKKYGDRVVDNARSENQSWFEKYIGGGLGTDHDERDIAKYLNDHNINRVAGTDERLERLAVVLEAQDKSKVKSEGQAKIQETLFDPDAQQKAWEIEKSRKKALLDEANAAKQPTVERPAIGKTQKAFELLEAVKDGKPPAKAELVKSPQFPFADKSVDRNGILAAIQSSFASLKVAEPPTQQVEVNGVAEVRTQASITVDLGAKATAILEKASKVGLTTDGAKLGKPVLSPSTSNSNQRGPR